MEEFFVISLRVLFNVHFLRMVDLTREKYLLVPMKLGFFILSRRSIIVLCESKIRESRDKKQGSASRENVSSGEKLDLSSKLAASICNDQIFTDNERKTTRKREIFFAEISIEKLSEKVAYRSMNLFSVNRISNSFSLKFSSNIPLIKIRAILISESCIIELETKMILEIVVSSFQMSLLRMIFVLDNTQYEQCSLGVVQFSI